MGFHRRPKRPPASFPSEQDKAAAELREKMEFHHLLSALGDHPALLRALGASIQRPSAFPPKAIPVISPWNVDVTPWSFTRLTNVDGQAFFSAVERSPLVAD